MSVLLISVLVITVRIVLILIVPLRNFKKGNIIADLIIRCGLDLLKLVMWLCYSIISVKEDIIIVWV